MATDVVKLELNVKSAKLLHHRTVIRLAGISSILLCPVTARMRMGRMGRMGRMSCTIAVIHSLGAAAVSTRPR